MPQLDILMIAMFATKFILVFIFILVVIEELYTNGILMLNISKDKLADNLKLFASLNTLKLKQC